MANSKNEFSKTSRLASEIASCSSVWRKRALSARNRLEFDVYSRRDYVSL